jgi:hypothetical protein
VITRSKILARFDDYEEILIDNETLEDIYALGEFVGDDFVIKLSERDRLTLHGFRRVLN